MTTFCCSRCWIFRSKFSCPSFRRCTDSSFSSLTLEERNELSAWVDCPHFAFQESEEMKRNRWKFNISYVRPILKGFHSKYILTLTVSGFSVIQLTTWLILQWGLQCGVYLLGRGLSDRSGSGICWFLKSPVQRTVSEIIQLVPMPSFKHDILWPEGEENNSQYKTRLYLW